MPIRWSALRVSQAMDEVEELINLAQPFFAQAKQKVSEARTIPNLPGYMDQRLAQIIWDIDRMDAVSRAITRVRRDIPEEALESERNRGGSQSALI